MNLMYLLSVIKKCSVLLCSASLTLSQTSPGFHMSVENVFIKTLQKGEIARIRAISPFPAVFSISLGNFLPFTSNLKLSSVNSFKLEDSIICHLGRAKHSLFKRFCHNVSSCVQTGFSAEACEKNSRWLWKEKLC